MTLNRQSTNSLLFKKKGKDSSQDMLMEKPARTQNYFQESVQSKSDCFEERIQSECSEMLDGDDDVDISAGDLGELELFQIKRV